MRRKSSEMRLQPGPDDRGIRLDVFLARFVQELTRSQLQSMNRRGDVLVDGRSEKAGYRIRGGEEIEVKPPVPAPLSVEPEAIPLDVCYEDKDIAVVEKPAGLVVHPGAGNRRSTLVNALLARFSDLSNAGGIERPGIVHRLDKWTSGLIIVAKNNQSHRSLSKSFEKREVRKTYLALVHGSPRAVAGEIDLNIGRDRRARTKMSVRREGGRGALSEYRTLEKLKEFALLEVRIRTGRTHQIRVHLTAIGHPVVGDNVYGEKANRVFARKHGDLGRYFLHASAIRFPHPATGTTVEFSSALPAELDRFLEAIRAGRV